MSFFSKSHFSKGVNANCNNIRNKTIINNVSMNGKNSVTSSNGSHGSANDTIFGDGIKKTIEIEVSDFDNLIVCSSLKVSFVVSDTPSVKVTADSNIIDLIDVSCFAGILDVGVKTHSSFEVETPVHIEVSNTRLNRVSVSGASHVDIQGISESTFKADVSGASRLIVSGTVEDNLLNVSGASRIDMKDLESVSLHVSASGCSDVTAHANKSAFVHASGMCQVVIHGNPADQRLSCSGMCDVQFL